jgi:beta-lactamase superfamily II metal-dependent hydrolase
LGLLDETLFRNPCGSIHNHSDLVLDAMPRLRVGYAASGPNSYGHPHRDVRDAVRAQRWANFRRVTQKHRTQITVGVELS